MGKILQILIIENRDLAHAQTFCTRVYERWLQALLSSAPRSRVLARLASLAQIGELARRLLQRRPSKGCQPVRSTFHQFLRERSELF